MTNRFKWRSAYDNTEEPCGNAAATTFTDQSRAMASMRDDCDINILAKRFGITDAPLPVEATDPRYYGDFTNVPDLRTALDLVRDAENRFMDLPPETRARFDNNPAKLWHFVNNPDNADLAVKWGLLKAYAPTPPTPKGDPLDSVSPST